MDWVKLDLSSAAILKKEVDSILIMLAELGVTGVLSSTMSVNTGFSSQEHSPDALLSIIPLIHERIDELEHFYTENCDDERAVLFEKERLRLRKALQLAISFSNSSKSVVTEQSGLTQRTSPSHSTKGQSTAFSQSQSVSNQSIKFAQTQNESNRSYVASKTNSPSNSNANNNPSSSNSIRSSFTQSKSPVNAGATPRLSPKPTGPGIYTWENNVKSSAASIARGRAPVSIEDVTYSPSPLNGFYLRDNSSPEEKFSELDRSRGPGLSSSSIFSSPSPGSTKFIDLQIILTPEEMTALAARKRSNRPDSKLFKSQAASTSVHSTTPFIEPARISKELLRPGHPDRWL